MDDLEFILNQMLSARGTAAVSSMMQAPSDHPQGLSLAPTVTLDRQLQQLRRQQHQQHQPSQMSGKLQDMDDSVAYGSCLGECSAVSRFTLPDNPARSGCQGCQGWRLQVAGGSRAA
eukprot:gene11999-12143_t